MAAVRIDRATSQFLDAARWISALAVAVSHVFAMIIVSRQPAGEVRPALAVLFYLSNVGHLAVVVFFVLSGYLVGGQELLRLVDGRAFDWRRYGIQRFSRIYCVFVPALILTCLLDQTGQAFFNQSELYSNPAINKVGSLMYPIVGRHDLSTLVGNLFMLQTIAVEPYGGDGPLWSLANEWWYYVVFALMLVSVSAVQPMTCRVAAVGSGLVGLVLLPPTLTWWFSLWLIGVGAAVLGRRWSGMRFGHASAIMAGGLSLALFGMFATSGMTGLSETRTNLIRLAIDSVAALTFAVALVSARNARFRGDGRRHAILASFSFTLYAVHFPILVFLSAVANSVFGMSFNQPLGWASLAWATAFTAVIVGCAWSIALVTERHTPAVRAALTAAFSRQAKLG